MGQLVIKEMPGKANGDLRGSGWIGSGWKPTSAVEVGSLRGSGWRDFAVISS